MGQVIRRGLRTGCRLPLAIGLRLLYNEFAWAYDGVSWLVSWGEWRSWQRTVLLHLVGPRVLELGFGTGNLLCDLAESHHQVWGLELSLPMVRIAQRKLHHRGLSLPLVGGRGQALPFASGAFDSLVVTFPSSFILQPDTLEEISRVLRTEGRLVMVPLAYPRRRGLVGRLFGWLYAAMGQRTPLPWEELLEPVGLCAVVEEMELPSSVVQVVTAVKKEEGNELTRHRVNKGSAHSLPHPLVTCYLIYREGRGVPAEDTQCFDGARTKPVCSSEAFVLKYTCHMVSVAEWSKAPGCGPGDRGFESHRSPRVLFRPSPGQLSFSIASGSYAQLIGSTEHTLAGCTLHVRQPS